MANFGLYEKPYIKLGSRNDVCYCCLKDTCEKEKRDTHDITHDLKGNLENLKVFYIRRSGQDLVICLDCFKNVYETIIQEELEFNKEATTVIDDKEIAEPVTEEIVIEETKKASIKKNK